MPVLFSGLRPAYSLFCPSSSNAPLGEDGGQQASQDGQATGLHSNCLASTPQPTPVLGRQDPGQCLSDPGLWAQIAAQESCSSFKLLAGR